MADVNRTIEISYRADIEQLERSLRAAGSLSEEQITSMIGSLNRQLEETERAANQTSESTRNAMEGIRDAAAEAESSLGDLEEEAEEAANQLEEMSGSAGDVGGALGDVGDVIGLVNPELGELASGASDAMGAFESLTGAGSMVTPTFLAMAAAAVTVAYVVSEVERAELEAAEAAQALKDEQEKLNEALIEYHEIQDQTAKSLGEFTADLNMAQAEVAMLKGEISEAEFESMKRDIEANKIAERLRKTTEDRIDALRGEQTVKEGNLQLAKDELRNIIEHRKGSEGLAEEFKKRAEAQEKIKKLEVELEEVAQKRVTLENELNQDYEGQAYQLLNLKKEAQDLREASRNRQKNIKSQNDLLKEQAEQAARLLQIQGFINDSMTEEENALLVIGQLQAQRLGPAAEIAFNFKVQKQELNDIKEQLKEQFATAQAIAETEEDKLKVKELEIQNARTLAVLEDEQREQRKAALEELRNFREEEHQAELERIKEETDTQIEAAKTAATSAIEAAQSIAEFNAMINADSIKAQQRLFRVNQAAAVSNIVMEAAQAIAGALGLPPIIRGLTIASITAGAAAQTGIVMAETPPTADMGGMIGNRDILRPDENMVRVLAGEAVLDRATVDRIGGEEGLQRLQAGGSMGNVVVVQPFKHFDRFIKQSNRTGVINKRNRVARY